MSFTMVRIYFQLEFPNCPFCYQFSTLLAFSPDFKLVTGMIQGFFGFEFFDSGIFGGKENLASVFLDGMI